MASAIWLLHEFWLLKKNILIKQSVLSFNSMVYQISILPKK
jgi:hypothetical protein